MSTSESDGAAASAGSVPGLASEDDDNNNDNTNDNTNTNNNTNNDNDNDDSSTPNKSSISIDTGVDISIGISMPGKSSGEQTPPPVVDMVTTTPPAAAPTAAAAVPMAATPPTSRPASPSGSSSQQSVPRLTPRLSRLIRNVDTLIPPVDLKDSGMPASAPVPVPLLSSHSTHTSSKKSSSTKKAPQKTTGPLDQMLGLDNPPLPSPKLPAKCPLFCCFYAEFDIKVGPMICFQSPQNFMDQDINISTDKIHEILGKTFERFKEKKETKSAAAAAQDENNDKTTKPSEEDKSKDLETESQSNKSAAAKTADGEVRLPEGTLSIFDSTSEYIITGNELTGKIINLSTHDMHIITRPTIIADQRYERNALLFSVGIVLRRAADPRPFRPILSKLALKLRRMEEESQFLSKPELRKQVQPLLEGILISLNSPQYECNLVLSKSNAVNLKLFHPPKPETSPVHDHEVPILLRRDLELQMYDWDLSINWVILHIDGVTNARLISIKAEVDLEMVRACLQVLKYHGVIALVDMFMYSNRYEFTDKATAMLAGKEPKLLQQTMDFVLKKPTSSSQGGLAGGISQMYRGSGGGGGGTTTDSGSDSPRSPSPFQNTPSASYPPPTMSLLGGSQKISSFKLASMTSQSLEKDPVGTPRMRHEDQRNMKAAISELYSACHRNISFGDLWITLTSETPSPLAVPNLRPASQRTSAPNHNRQSSRRKAADNAFDSDPFREQIDSMALSPLEANQLEAMRRPIAGNLIDWEDVFKRFDHRRFASFGLIHCLLARVHCYPYFPGLFPLFGDNRSQFKHGVKSQQMEDKELAHQVASFMDGTRCDDELVCQFEKPFTVLVDLVEKYGGRKIVTVYATAPDC